MYKRQLLKGAETGIIFGAVTDNCGNALHVSFRVVLVPGLGTNLFSVTSAMQKGVASLFYADNPRLQSESGDVCDSDGVSRGGCQRKARVVD